MAVFVYVLCVLLRVVRTRRGAQLRGVVQIEFQQRELDRLRTVIRRLEGQVAEFQKPEMTDECLSARSYSDVCVPLRFCRCQPRRAATRVAAACVVWCVRVCVCVCLSFIFGGARVQHGDQPA
jgi:hypothetical protein